ncbi:B12-binding domain-containing radical SAM protein [bacterium]|nr:B12-binding domain-containing radical SAM protein [bacterium]MCB9475948.1 B12-binding domain-containing radical SAM protein [Deltaproteobacteria bacterium]MCB9480125.1 B12-binding domain-containing radical SAM protein [Deltaproteobacteria bacterium]
MARVLLIKTRAWSMKKFGTGACPPLGLLSLISYARQERPGRHEFRLIDERVHTPTAGEYGALVAEFDPDLIGLSVLSSDVKRMGEVSRLFRHLCPHIPIVVGGPHASAHNATLLDKVDIDFVLAGEGELGFVGLLDSLDAGHSCPTEPIVGLSYRRGDNVLVENAPNTRLLDMANSPWPAWDMVDFDDYKNLTRMTPISHGKYAPLFTSRGCPYRCNYCHEVFTKKFRAKGPVEVVDEIEYLMHERQVEEFEIYDDIFNLDYDRAMGICHEIIGRGLKPRLTFPNGIRGDLLDRPLLEAMAAAGTIHLAFAIESASPRIQKMSRKNNRLPKITENIEIAAELGIFPFGFFMLGFPTETREEIQSTIDFAIRSKLNGALFFQVIPFAGTELARTYFSDEAGARALGTIAATAETGIASTRDHERDMETGHYVWVTDSMAQIPTRELRKLQLQAYFNFYYDLGRIWRILRTWPLPYSVLLRKAYLLSYHLVVDRPIVWTHRLIKTIGRRLHAAIFSPAGAPYPEY